MLASLNEAGIKGTALVGIREPLLTGPLIRLLFAVRYSARYEPPVQRGILRSGPGRLRRARAGEQRPTSTANAARLSGPLEFAIETRWPSLTRRRASAPPMPPAPM